MRSRELSGTVHSTCGVALTSCGTSTVLFMARPPFRLNGEALANYIRASQSRKLALLTPAKFPKYFIFILSLHGKTSHDGAHQSM